MKFKAKKFEALGVPRTLAREWAAEANTMVAQAKTMALALAGEDPERVQMMAEPGADAEMRSLWLRQMGRPQALTLDAGPEPDEGRIDEVRIMMANDADPDMRRMWLAELAGPEPEPSGSSAPLGMDDERYQLHTDAKALAATKMARDPRLDEGAAYSLSVIELEDAKFGGPI